MKTEPETFQGFEGPKENWTRIPNVLIELLPTITTLAELKILIYTLRHTWGFMEYEAAQQLTIDEYMKGRKLSSGDRYDPGTGMSKPSIVNGLSEAEKHGFIQILEEGKNRFYRIHLSPKIGKESLPIRTGSVKKFYRDGKDSLPIRTPSDQTATGSDDPLKIIIKNIIHIIGSDDPIIREVQSVFSRVQDLENRLKAAEDELKRKDDLISEASKKSPKSKEPLPWSALTLAMHNGIPEKIRPVRAAYHKHNTDAKALFQAGITPEQVSDFVQWKYATDHWMWTGSNNSPVMITMSMVAQNINASSEKVRDWVLKGRMFRAENVPPPARKSNEPDSWREEPIEGNPGAFRRIPVWND